jgi:hypothetical protein
MSAREFFNNNPAVVTGGAVLVLVICLTLISCQLFGLGGGGASDQKVVYYDLSTDKLMLLNATDRPASPLEDNANAFRAMIHACGECGKIKDGMSQQELEDAGMFVAYLMEIPTREDMQMGPGGMMGIQYLTLETREWYPEQSQEGQAIMVNAFTCPDGSRAVICQP